MGESADRRLFEAVVSTSPTALLLIDEHGAVRLANPAATELLGYSRDELTRSRLTDLVPDDARGDHGARFARARDGREVPVELRETTVELGQGTMRLLWLGDASSRYTTRALEAQLAHSQKMEAIGRLAGGVAHDFNNLLTGILSFASFALEDLPPGAASAEDLLSIVEAARKAEELTSQLLAFSRRKPVSPRVVSLAEVVGGVDRLLSRVLGEDVELVSSISSDVWNVRIDPSALEQVLVNLAVNARDAMPRGGTLTVGASNCTVGAAGALGQRLPAGEYARISVADTGTGIPEDIRASIFEPFFTTKGVGKGSGLGLSLCYGIITQADGHIVLDSELDAGSTFHLFLPRADQPVQPVFERPTSTDPRGIETVLVVEDEPQVRELAIRALRKFGYHVLAASNGDDAIRMVATGEADIDLLITDVIMPGMSGEQLARAISALSPTTRTLFVSGYGEDAIASRGVLTEGIELLQKPFTPAVLGLRVRSVLDAAAAENDDFG